MQRSSHRILTTHYGSLPRPEDLIEMYHDGCEPDVIGPRVHQAVAEVVQKQIDIGIDIVGDGEYGKPMRSTIDYGSWATYVYSRLAGYEFRPVEEPLLLTYGKDRADFANFYKVAGDLIELPAGGIPWPHCTSAVSYVGQEESAREVADLKSATAGASITDVFMPAISPASIESMQPNEFYESDDEYVFAIASAMREEYKAIVDAGFVLQIDDPALAVCYDWWFAGKKPLDEYLSWAQIRVDALNHALEGLPAERIRYYLCWGSWHGPHSTDIPLREIIEMVLSINAQAFTLEASNVRHEHEWKVWQEVELPADRILIPGVVSHATEVLEHPELVADRIVRYAELVGRENVIAGTDCGLGGRIHPELAWAKLKVLSEGAKLASERLWN